MENRELLKAIEEMMVKMEAEIDANKKDGRVHSRDDQNQSRKDRSQNRRQ
jgi:hypothetical protein